MILLEAVGDVDGVLWVLHIFATTQFAINFLLRELIQEGLLRRIASTCNRAYGYRILVRYRRLLLFFLNRTVYMIFEELTLSLRNGLL